MAEWEQGAGWALRGATALEAVAWTMACHGIGWAVRTAVGFGGNEASLLREMERNSPRLGPVQGGSQGGPT